ncbi:MAG TPA: AHH domain-containing protein [Burkholderiales bacterium]|nr:AHH domain-containing protein [Burkholderiales bacterium]
MGGKSKHVTAADLVELHQPSGGAGGKGCLSRHQKREEGHKCSHQWQARVKAEGDSGLYNVPGRPRWHLGYGSNFNHFQRPYWHNAHHIIPNGALKTSIAKAAKKTAGMGNLIKQGLLKAEYNLNDKINMIILPMEMRHGVVLGLPRHLKGDEVGPDEEGEFFSHEAYSDEAEESLSPIIDEFKSKAAEAIDAVAGTHDKPDVTLSKAKLEALSERLYNAIKSAGKKSPGEAISNLTDLIFV